VQLLLTHEIAFGLSEVRLLLEHLRLHLAERCLRPGNCSFSLLRVDREEEIASLKGFAAKAEGAAATAIPKAKTANERRLNREFMVIPVFQRMTGNLALRTAACWPASVLQLVLSTWPQGKTDFAAESTSDSIGWRPCDRHQISGG
jgi:hypothetical protein